jgi:hypothetical protein
MLLIGLLSAVSIVCVDRQLENLGDLSLQPAGFSLAFQKAGDCGWIDAQPLGQRLLAVDTALEHADLDFDPVHC